MDDVTISHVFSGSIPLYGAMGERLKPPPC